jgi:hypothetical protein
MLSFVNIPRPFLFSPSFYVPCGGTAYPAGAAGGYPRPYGWWYMFGGIPYGCWVPYAIPGTGPPAAMGMEVNPGRT